MHCYNLHLTLHYSPTSLQPYGLTALQSYILTALQPYSLAAFQPYSLTVLRPYGLTALQPYSLTALQPYSLTALQPYSLTALQPYSLTALQPYSFTALQLYSLTSLQSHGLTALDPYGLTSFRPYGLTSLHPATNGLAERYVGELKDKLDKIGDTGEPVQTKLDRLLLTYRATPTALEKSPSELVMNRQTRIIFSALRGKTSEQEELRFLKITLTTSLSLHRPNQFLCVILANEPNGFQEQLWKF